jgi:purine-binding chemotaxis protein CheW
LASIVAQIDAPDEVRSLIFRAAGRVYACDVEAVREVVPLGVVTRLPGAPQFVRGLINVRGTIVTVIDAGAYLHGRHCEGEGMVMLVDMGRGAAGLLVSAVANVRSIRDDEGYEQLDVRALVAGVVITTEDE